MLSRGDEPTRPGTADFLRQSLPVVRPGRRLSEPDRQRVVFADDAAPAASQRHVYAAAREGRTRVRSRFWIDVEPVFGTPTHRPLNTVPRALDHPSGTPAPNPGPAGSAIAHLVPPRAQHLAPPPAQHLAQQFDALGRFHLRNGAQPNLENAHPHGPGRRRFAGARIEVDAGSYQHVAAHTAAFRGAEVPPLRDSRAPGAGIDRVPEQHAVALMP